MAEFEEAQKKLIVPDDFIDTIEKMDPNHEAYDLLWRGSNYKYKFSEARANTSSGLTSI